MLIKRRDARNNGFAWTKGHLPGLNGGWSTNEIGSDINTAFGTFWNLWGTSRGSSGCLKRKNGGAGFRYGRC